jgi:hypothetical protein
MESQGEVGSTAKEGLLCIASRRIRRPHTSKRDQAAIVGSCQTVDLVGLVDPYEEAREHIVDVATGLGARLA